MRAFSGGKRQTIVSVAIDPTGRRVAAAAPKYTPTRVWDIATGELVAEIPAYIVEPTGSVHFAPSGRLLITTSLGLQAVDPDRPATLGQVPGTNGLADSFVMDASGSWGVCSCRAANENHRLVAIDRPGDPDARELWTRWPGNLVDVLAVGVLPGGESVLSFERGVYGTVYPMDRVVVRSRTHGGVRGAWPVQAREGRVVAAPWSPWLAALDGSTMRVYPAGGPLAEPTKTLQNDGKKHFTAAAFHPSGNFLLAASNDATVKVYDTRSWEAARTFTWDIGRMRSVAFSADGTLAAAGGDSGKVVVWDVDV